MQATDAITHSKIWQ